MSIRKLIVLSSALLLCAACAKMEEPAKPQPTPPPVASSASAAPAASYEQELEQWKAKRLASLKSFTKVSNPSTIPFPKFKIGRKGYSFWFYPNSLWNYRTWDSFTVF